MSDTAALKPGMLVTAEYKGGKYVGELLSIEGSRAKVRVMAVLKHPAQGDLHHPMQADVAMFHQRRALSHREVANVMPGSLSQWGGEEAPDYHASLREALEKEMAAMQALGTPFGDRSAAELRQLAKEYVE